MFSHKVAFISLWICLFIKKKQYNYSNKKIRRKQDFWKINIYFECPKGKNWLKYTIFISIYTEASVS